MLSINRTEDQLVLHDVWVRRPPRWWPVNLEQLFLAVLTPWWTTAESWWGTDATGPRRVDDQVDVVVTVDRLAVGRERWPRSAVHGIRAASDGVHLLIGLPSGHLRRYILGVDLEPGARDTLHATLVEALESGP